MVNLETVTGSSANQQPYDSFAGIDDFARYYGLPELGEHPNLRRTPEQCARVGHAVVQTEAVRDIAQAQANSRARFLPVAPRVAHSIRDERASMQRELRDLGDEFLAPGTPLSRWRLHIGLRWDTVVEATRVGIALADTYTHGRTGDVIYGVIDNAIEPAWQFATHPGRLLRMVGNHLPARQPKPPRQQETEIRPPAPSHTPVEPRTNTTEASTHSRLRHLGGELRAAADRAAAVFRGLVSRRLFSSGADLGDGTYWHAPSAGIPDAQLVGQASHKPLRGLRFTLGGAGIAAMYAALWAWALPGTVKDTVWLAAKAAIKRDDHSLHTEDIRKIWESNPERAAHVRFMASPYRTRKLPAIVPDVLDNQQAKPASMPAANTPTDKALAASAPPDPWADTAPLDGSVPEFEYTTGVRERVKLQGQQTQERLHAHLQSLTEGEQDGPAETLSEVAAPPRAAPVTIPLNVSVARPTQPLLETTAAPPALLRVPDPGWVTKWRDAEAGLETILEHIAKPAAPVIDLAVVAETARREHAPVKGGPVPITRVLPLARDALARPIENLEADEAAMESAAHFDPSTTYRTRRANAITDYVSIDMNEARRRGRHPVRDWPDTRADPFRTMSQDTAAYIADRAIAGLRETQPELVQRAEAVLAQRAIVLAARAERERPQKPRESDWIATDIVPDSMRQAAIEAQRRMNLGTVATDALLSIDFEPNELIYAERALAAGMYDLVRNDVAERIARDLQSSLGQDQRNYLKKVHAEIGYYVRDAVTALDHLPDTTEEAALLAELATKAGTEADQLKALSRKSIGETFDEIAALSITPYCYIRGYAKTQHDRRVEQRRKRAEAQVAAAEAV